MRFSKQGVMEGIKQMIPIGVFVIPFGLAFGAAAIDRGLSSTETIVMSLFVFSGAAQFAVLDLWQDPLLLLPIALTVLAVSSRHILLGAALSPWLRQLPPLSRFGSLFLLSDPNFASSQNAFQQGSRDAGILVGGGVVIWATWVLGTLLGVVSGNAFGELDRFGIDVVMAAYFVTILLGGGTKRSAIVPYTIAAGLAVAGWYYLPSGWNIMLAAVVGGLVGVVRHDR